MAQDIEALVARRQEHLDAAREKRKELPSTLGFTALFGYVGYRFGVDGHYFPSAVMTALAASGIGEVIRDTMAAGSEARQAEAYTQVIAAEVGQPEHTKDAI